MKKLFFIHLLSIFAYNIAIANNEITKNAETRRQTYSNLNKDLIKGSIGLACTAMLSYLSYKCTVNNVETDSSNLIDQADTWVHKNIFRKFMDFENNRFHQYISCSLSILTSIAAFECGKYTIKKIKNLIEQKKLEIRKKNEKTNGSSFNDNSM